MSAGLSSRGWKLDRGWLVRSRSRSGSESKQHFGSLDEARDEARKRAASRQFREVWIDENDLVTRPFRDLEPRKRPALEDRKHVLSVEESDVGGGE